MPEETKQLLIEILDLLKRIDGRLSAPAPVPSSEHSTQASIPSSKKLSIGEFLQTCAPTSKTEAVLAIGYFLEKHDGVSPFNASDLKRMFRAAKEIPPANVNDAANWCVKNRHMMEEPEKKDNLKAWVLTRTGEQHVESSFGHKKVTE